MTRVSVQQNLGIDEAQRAEGPDSSLDRNCFLVNIGPLCLSITLFINWRTADKCQLLDHWNFAKQREIEIGDQRLL